MLVTLCYIPSLARGKARRNYSSSSISKKQMEESDIRETEPTTDMGSSANMPNLSPRGLGATVVTLRYITSRTVVRDTPHYQHSTSFSEEHDQGRQAMQMEESNTSEPELWTSMSTGTSTETRFGMSTGTSTGTITGTSTDMESEQ